MQKPRITQGNFEGKNTSFPCMDIPTPGKDSQIRKEFSSKRESPSRKTITNHKGHINPIELNHKSQFNRHRAKPRKQVLILTNFSKQLTAIPQ